MKNALLLLGAAGLSTMIATGSAFAYPASVTGFYFGSANTNAGQNISFDISTQGTVGACQQVVGTFGNDNISGFYCPTTGEISFLRSTSDLGITYQVFDGQLSAVAQTAASTSAERSRVLPAATTTAPSRSRRRLSPSSSLASCRSCRQRRHKVAPIRDDRRDPIGIAAGSIPAWLLLLQAHARE